MLIYSGNSDFGDKAIIRQNGIHTEQNVVLPFLEVSYCCLLSKFAKCDISWKFCTVVVRIQKS